MGEEEADLISRIIEMIESGKYTEGILLTMAMLAVAEEVKNVVSVLREFCEGIRLMDYDHGGEFSGVE